MMKYLLCVLLMLFIISSVGLCQEGIIFFYDFDKEQEGKPPSEPWKATAAGEVKVANFPSAANKSVKITDTGSGAGMTLILDQPITDKTVSLEFKWYREDWGAAEGVEIFYVMNQKCPDDWSGVCISTQGKSYQYNDSGTWNDVANIEDKVWHDIKLVMYLDKNKYDFYWDNELKGKNAGFRKFEGIERAGIDKFNVANVGDGGYNFVFYFDDIMLYEGTTKPMAVKSESKLATIWGSVKLSALQDSIKQYPGGHKGTRFEKGIMPRSKFVP